MNQCRLTLGVTDPARSAGFYRVFFDCEPTRVSSDAVVFAMSEPPLEVVLTRSPTGKVAPIASQGLRFADRATVVVRRERLHQAGLKTHTQECTHCGYNEQFKVHVADPDGHYWHLYVVDRLIHPNTIHRCLEGDEAVLPSDPVIDFCEYFAEHPRPDRLPHNDDSLDEARLFGAITGDADLAAEAFRVIRPGGTIRAEGVPGDVAARLKLLLDAGFQGLTIHGGRIHGFKPEHPAATPKRLVLYKGPFRQTRDDRGNVYPRGRRVQVDEATWTLLRRGEAAEQFLFLFPFGYPAAGPVRPPVDAFAEAQS